MESRQKRTPHSLTFQLSLWIGCAIVAVGLLASLLSFKFARHEANELQDAQLQDISELIDSDRLSYSNWIDADDSDNSNLELVIQSLTPNVNAATDTTSPLKIPPNLVDGFHNVDSDNETWRVYIHTLHTGQRIAVGQNTVLRDEIANDGALRTLIPILCLLPTLIVIITIFIRMMLAPIIRLSAIVDKQNETNMEPLSDDRVALEMRPFINSINNLMARVKESITQQRQFIAHAAHELRSPLTALSLQAANLEHTQMSSEASERLQILRQGLVRAKQLVEQLLTLAKIQTSHLNSLQPVSLTELVAQVMNEILSEAEQKNIVVESSRLDDVDVIADQHALYIVLRNLVDNAVRYTPEGGTVDVRAYIHEGILFFEVQDSGSGISENEMEKVFIPFYRGSDSKEIGNGLGLAIVYETAKRIGGDIKLENVAVGLKVTYSQSITITK